VALSVFGVASRRRGLASGLAWTADTLLTTASAIGRADSVSVIRPDGETVTGEIRGVDRGTDLAVISCQQTRLAPPVWRREPAARVGDVVFAVGRDGSGRVHASFGHIGAAAGPWRTWRGGDVDRLLRLDGGLYPGLNGAPVADGDGRVLGIASAWLSRHHGVVLPIATLERVGAALLADGRVAHGYLGVAIQPVALSPAMRAALQERAGDAQGGGDAPAAPAAHDAADAADVSVGAGTDGGAGSGLLVTGIGDDTPAARAGVLVGDILVAAGGRPLPDVESLRATLTGIRAGSRIAFRIVRGGRPQTVEIEVMERPTRSHC
jgi:S1-C subfamily serine protease